MEVILGDVKLVKYLRSCENDLDIQTPRINTEDCTSSKLINHQHIKGVAQR